MQLHGRIAKGFRAARDAALKSKVMKAKVGASILRGTTIISSDYNKNSFRASLKRRFPKLMSTHAEMGAILKAIKMDKKLLHGAELFVYSETVNGNIRNSKPCMYCMLLAKECGIKRIYYYENGKVAYMTL